MGALILSVIVDVLVHVPIKHFQGIGIGLIPSSAWFFPVLDAPELVVLDPEVRLEDFRRRRKPEHGGIAFCDPVLVLIAKRF